MVRERMLDIYIIRGDVGGRSCSSSKTTPTMSMPLDFRQILTICSSLTLGPTHQRWAVYVGIWLEMVVGPIC